MPRFSVVIPARDREHTIVRAVRSVLAQTVRDLEILIGDDGSTDSTARLAEEMAAEDSRIRLFSWQPNLGVSAARNRLITASDSDFICLLDSDDAWLPEKLELQEAALNAHPEAGCCHTKEVWYRGEKEVKPPAGYLRNKEDAFLFNLRRCTISSSSSVIRRNALASSAPYDEGLFACEDQDLWLRMALRTNFLSVNRPLTLRYGGRDDQLSVQQWGLDRFRIAVLLKIEELDLSRKQSTALRGEVAAKAAILGKGYRKRNKPEQAAMYEKLHRLYK